MCSIITFQPLSGQDTVTTKNGKVIQGKIISVGNGIELLAAKDTMKFTADEVASLKFSNTNKNCPCGDTNRNGNSSAITNGNTKKIPAAK